MLLIRGTTTGWFMEVSNTFTCPCNPVRQYKDLKQHQKTKMHHSWVARQELKDTRVQSKQYENELERLRRHKESLETELLNRIHYLEHEVAYWKAASSNVFLG